MREIHFRGKRIDNGEWVYCVAFPHDNAGAVTMFFQHPLDGSFEGREVDPSTFGEYTGLTDKNGKKIFEGDIVRNHNGQIYEMVFIEKYNCYYFVRESSVYAGIKPKDIEVIGNIHDNPELLEVKQ